MQRRRVCASAVVAATTIALVGLGGRVARGQPPDAGRGGGVPDWSVQYGGFKHLSDVFPAGPEAVWWGLDRYQAPDGRRQTGFVRHDGAMWRVTQVADGASLVALAFATPSYGMAVGLGGAVYRWDGVAWLPLPSGTNRDLDGVSLLAPDVGWACGDGGTLLRWDGRSWTKYPLDFQLTLSSISACVARPGGEAWATSLSGRILHFDGTTWQEAATPSITRPTAMAFSPSGRALVAGAGSVLELKSGTWRRLGDPRTSYRSVTFVGEDAYLVANDKLVRLNGDDIVPVNLAEGPVDLSLQRFERVVGGAGGAWALATSGTLAWIAGDTATYRWPVTPRLETLDLLDPTTLWAGGRSTLAGFVGRTSAGWTVQPDPATGEVVWDLDLLTADDGWALSSDERLPGTMAMWHRDAQRWSPWPIDKTWELRRLQMLSPTEGWASGGNVVARWIDGAWDAVSGVPVGASGVLSMLRGGTDPLGFFGTFGGIYRMSGTDWEFQGLPNGEDVLAVDMLAADRGWAVTAGMLVTYDGSRWHLLQPPRPPDSHYVDVDALAVDNVWVLLNPPALLHWTGRDWEFHDLGPLGSNAVPTRMRVVRDLERGGASDVWLVGSPPVIARYRVLTARSTVALPLLFRP
jgi:hypothetical protein